MEVFEIKSLDWTIALSYLGHNMEGKWRIYVNYTLAQDLPPADFRREMPPTSRSTVLTVDTEAYK